MDVFSREHGATMVARLLVIVLGVALLVLNVPGAGALADAKFGMAALAALACNQLALLLTATRLQRILQIFALPTRWRDVLWIHLQSMFYFFFVPMTVGLELSRFAKLKRLHPSAAGTAIAGVVLLDRVIGVAGALLFSLALLPLVTLGGGERVGFSWAMLGVAVAAGSTLAGGVVAWPRSRRQLYAVWLLLAPRWRHLFPAAVLTLASQAAFALAAQQGASAFGIAIGFVPVLFGLSVAMLFIIVPVSFAGAGPAEAACAAIFSMLGLAPRAALIVSGIVYSLRLFAALQGGLVEIAGDLRGLRRLYFKP